ncbi:MAG: RNA polymerase sigma factor [Acidimicrobiia bacterium]|nr:RNA polymerase sigma factor [Acidimicrobiia bacterium]MDH4306711.1 RNA polymerase sigma factor [Acidimicrobiia bacterium]MDH5292686.1 RNA polymerase sigma factor [Acidimicrobiia bacterium]
MDAPRTIETFYRDHSQAVFAFLVSLTRDRARAEDLMQDTFVKATRSLGGYRGGSPRAWLFAIARTVFLDDTRRRHPIPVEEGLDRAVEEADYAEHDAVERALNALPERQRTALVLSDRLDLSGAEVAEAMGITPGAARVLIHRARLEFRAIYQEDAR